MTGRQSFIGSPQTVAEAIDAHVQAEACDGFILIPHITPGGLDRFADEVVPLLQERGVFRTDYEGPTLRDHLGLAGPWHGLAPAGARELSGYDRAVLDPDVEPVLDPDVERYLAELAETPPAAGEPDLATLRREYDAAAPGLFGPAPRSTRSRTTTPTASRSASTARPAASGRRSCTCTAAAGCSAALTRTDPLCQTLAARSGQAVVAVDYRLAPEHRYPAAVEDAWTAFRWAHARFDRLAVGGDSAGGHLSATVARRARDAGLGARAAGARLSGHRPRLRVAVLPAVHDRAGVPHGRDALVLGAVPRRSVARRRA